MDTTTATSPASDGAAGCASRHTETTTSASGAAAVREVVLLAPPLPASVKAELHTSAARNEHTGLIAAILERGWPPASIGYVLGLTDSAILQRASTATSAGKRRAREHVDIPTAPPPALHPEQAAELTRLITLIRAEHRSSPAVADGRMRLAQLLADYDRAGLTATRLAEAAGVPAELIRYERKRAGLTATRDPHVDDGLETFSKYLKDIGLVETTVQNCRAFIRGFLTAHALPYTQITAGMVDAYINPGRIHPHHADRRWMLRLWQSWCRAEQDAIFPASATLPDEITDELRAAIARGDAAALIGELRADGWPESVIGTALDLTPDAVWALTTPRESPALARQATDASPVTIRYLPGPAIPAAATASSTDTTGAEPQRTATPVPGRGRATVPDRGRQPWPDLRTAIMTHAARQPHLPAIIGDGFTVTYADLHATAAALADRLPVTDGRLVALPATDDPTTTVDIVAVTLAGGVPLPIDARLPSRRHDSLIDRATRLPHRCGAWLATGSAHDGTYRITVTGGESPAHPRKADALRLPGPGRTALITLPLHEHQAAETALRILARGTTLLLCDPHAPSTTVADIIATHQPTWALLAEPHLTSLASDITTNPAHEALTNLNTIITTRRPDLTYAHLESTLPPGTLIYWWEPPAHDGALFPGTSKAGTPISGLQIRIAHRGHTPGSTPDAGPIEARNPRVVRHDTTEPCRERARAPWTTSGDIGHLTKDGRLIVTPETYRA
ncbi:hypothetical protein J2S43_001066 [Catenuloplanes nepalensis]|uniref:AMP-dependent synthetase/ligase domain-containing protein n=1 Tax=Catenuloplanes nepalensis TaxID=587533 RepID=A0ABT9MMA2_9ACTN|nr:AMP-binding protein [Catenuloplanes nepalensis]MDP9792554.1 hypothetical protein [Catenuloplanes nepalensis]